MFESTSPFVLFDYFRVPYRIVSADAESQPIEQVRACGDAATLAWPTLRDGAATIGSGSYVMESIPVIGHVAHEAEVQARLRRIGGSWREAHAVRDARGRYITAVWQRDDHSTFLPFDPNELIVNFWTERYQEFLGSAAATRLVAFARRGYYEARRFLPRPLQMGLRRTFSHVQSKTRFPRWPVETAAHDLYDFLFELLARVAGRPIPFLAPWPKEWSWALVLTHDVEGPVGYANLRRLREVELDAGLRSSWNFVPERDYTVELDLVEELWQDGFEVGVHGLRHDGRDVSSLSNLRRRLPLIRSYAERWQAKGFRSPATIRSPRLLPLLGFDYDSSYTDTAPFEPQAGGCCTWLPYMIDELVELPITVPQDHTVFELLQRADERLWVDKARFLREQGGMALVLTHPDYIGNVRLLESYRRLLEEFATDDSAWKALPRDVSAWWRRRAQSGLREVQGEWEVVGPVKDEARISFALAERTRPGTNRRTGASPAAAC